MKQIGIVGVGYWGPNYARILSAYPEVQFAWCADLNAQALKTMQRLYPSIRVSTNAQDLVKDPMLDGVIIVTPAQTHYALAKDSLNAGKHVLVEKPLTTTVTQAKKLIELAKKKKKTLMVDHTFVFNSTILKLKEKIESNELGKMLYAYGEYNALGPIRRDVSAMWDLPHFIYVANFLFGSLPTAVTAIGRSFYQSDMEDVVFLTLEYPKNILFNLSCSWIDPVKIRKMTLVGDKKMAIFDDMAREGKLTIYDKGVEISKDPNFAQLQLVVRNGDVTIPHITEKEPLREVLNAFLSAIDGKPTQPSGGVEGLALVKVLEAAQKSLDSKGKKIKIL